ncbi:hypothetical protein BV133_1340 [Blastochloris viridis]|uniref:Uncharacterized protein n=1 Tax=Blastochloris viridis TaxID=1079 RepID=A0A182D199_BLAVI|nr:hypothetical protein BV133_1340 [Blastochloris viridis]
MMQNPADPAGVRSPNDPVAIEDCRRRRFGDHEVIIHTR